MAGESEEPDKLVIEDIETIAIDKRPTKPLHERLSVSCDLDDPDAVANFLEAVARLIREKRRIVLIID
jgi:hypothetical protein